MSLTAYYLHWDDLKSLKKCIASHYLSLQIKHTALKSGMKSDLIGFEKFICMNTHVQKNSDKNHRNNSTTLGTITELSHETEDFKNLIILLKHFGLLNAAQLHLNKHVCALMLCCRRAIYRPWISGEDSGWRRMGLDHHGITQWLKTQLGNKMLKPSFHTLAAGDDGLPLGIYAWNISWFANSTQVG